LIAYTAVMIAPIRSPVVAMALIHVGMSPQAGGRPHGLPKTSSPIRKPTTTPMPTRPWTRLSLLRGLARLVSGSDAPGLPVVMGEGYGASGA
jgi:hypothetical protein